MNNYVHQHEKIECDYQCEYCPFCFNGCPQCGKGTAITQPTNIVYTCQDCARNTGGRCDRHNKY